MTHLQFSCALLFFVSQWIQLFWNMRIVKVFLLWAAVKIVVKKISDLHGDFFKPILQLHWSAVKIAQSFRVFLVLLTPISSRASFLYPTTVLTLDLTKRDIPTRLYKLYNNCFYSGDNWPYFRVFDSNTIASKKISLRRFFIVVMDLLIMSEDLWVQVPTA